MDDKNEGFYIIADCGDGSVKVRLPNRVFSPLAEQLRWDSIRAGLISRDDWFKVAAFAAAWPTGAPQFEQVVISLVTQSGNPLCRCFAVSRLQGLDLFITSRLLTSSDSPQCQEVILEWSGGKTEWGVRVPLSPFKLPFGKFMRKSRPDLPIGPSRLFVSENVKVTLEELSNESIRRKAELGGCLIGRIPDLDSVVVTDAVCALPDVASPEQFHFNPRFWLDVSSGLAHSGTRILGWFHSHLCDSGFPRALSHCDLEIFHKHFTAPWSVAALICASKEQFEIKWFGWQQGCVVPVETQPAAITADRSQGEISWQR